jgi:hypothetical protein
MEGLILPSSDVNEKFSEAIVNDKCMGVGAKRNEFAAFLRIPFCLELALGETF